MEAAPDLKSNQHNSTGPLLVVEQTEGSAQEPWRKPLSGTNLLNYGWAGQPKEQVSPLMENFSKQCREMGRGGETEREENREGDFILKIELELKLIF